MINDKSKGSASGAGSSSNLPTPVNPAPLFRRSDWVTFFITFLAVWAGYMLTLAPELTLEDSGELAAGSYYAGIPHPPGYPVWTIYTWIWTVLLPFGNIAWRVGVGVATSSALAAGLLGLLVSRGSSLLIEGIEELKTLSGKWEAAICTVSGVVSGMIIGFNGFLWSQSVIVEVYAFSVMSFMIVLLCMLRWIYAPHQSRYLYYAMFAFGVSFTNHQTLIVAAMGIEVAIAAAHQRLGRNLWLGNSIIYIAGLILKSQHMLGAMEANAAIFTIFNVVGVGSIAAYIWFAFLTRETGREFAKDALLAVTVLAAASGPAFGVLWLVSLGALIGFLKLAWPTRKTEGEWHVMLVCGVCWLLGAAFYFYMPLAGMSNPPMQWGYPRTVEGFVHAFTRGQYEKANPTDIIGDPMRFVTQLQMLGTGIVEEFNWVFVFLALVPFLFFRYLHKRERAWIVGITAIYLCLGVLLLILLNPPPDRAAQDLVRVFFGASHSLIALMVGYGMTLVAAYMATNYRSFRSLGLMGGAFALALALYSFVAVTPRAYFAEGIEVSISELMRLTAACFTDKDQYGLPIFAGLLLIGAASAFVGSLLLYRNRAPLLITLAVFSIIPAYPILNHWAGNEQRNHWFGYWFGHDMFTPPFNGSDGKPIYPEMAKDAILYGGTDPGRFCPTYMIFCDSFVEGKDLPPMDRKFDRRDVYIITQNALADGTYLNYIRAHYNRSKQIDAPFFQELARPEKERAENYGTNTLARAMRPLDNLFTSLGDKIEKRRRTYTSWFDNDHFTDLKGFVNLLRPDAKQDPLSKYIYDQLSAETRHLIAGPTNEQALRSALARDLNLLIDRDLKMKEAIREKQAQKSGLQQEISMGKGSDAKNARVEALDKEIGRLGGEGMLHTPERFASVKISDYLRDFIQENLQSHSRVRMNRLLLEAAYPGMLMATKGGVYPDREMYIASPEDSRVCFENYLVDAQKRMQLNQLKPGEDVRVIDGRVQVSGQVAVMAINGLLTKVMFDANPKNEFYVEESFPLDWMFPHLVPYGIIMRINRQPLAELTDDMVRRDHEFWSQFSERLIGNWITYDTKVSEIADFVERVYLRKNFKGFIGDRKFARDDQAQKAFSKLRSSIGGVYNYRIGAARNPAEQQRMVKEADFAFRQAFAFCPYSPEAVFRYVNLLLTTQRFDDALIIATTCLKLDPFNGQVLELVNKLESWKKQSRGAAAAQPPGSIPDLEKQFNESPSNFQAGFNLAMHYLQSQQSPKALEVLDRIASHPNAEPAAYRALFQAFSSIGNMGRVQSLVQTVEARLKGNPDSLDMALALAEGYRVAQQKDKAVQMLEKVVSSPKADGNTILQAAQQFAAYNDFARLEQALSRLVQISPKSPETWYDYAALKAALGKLKESTDALRTCVELSNARLLTNPAASNLASQAKTDGRFTALHQDPAFKQLTSVK